MDCEILKNKHFFLLYTFLSLPCRINKYNLINDYLYPHLLSILLLNISLFSHLVMSDSFCNPMDLKLTKSKLYSLRYWDEIYLVLLFKKKDKERIIINIHVLGILKIKYKLEKIYSHKLTKKKSKNILNIPTTHTVQNINHSKKVLNFRWLQKNDTPQTDGEKMETVSGFIFLGSKITAVCE